MSSASSENFIFIGDIAGQYDALMRLLKKCPDYLPISVGDMVDRGPDSKKVLDFFMKNGKALLGNHEHMMLDYQKYKMYNCDIWAGWNGGAATLESFKGEASNFLVDENKIPEDVIEWVSNLPLYMEIEGALISHAPKHPFLTLEQCCELVKIPFKGCFSSGLRDPEFSIIWNRIDPEPIPDKFQIFGHNGYHYIVTEYEENEEDKEENKENERKEAKEFAVCIDASRQGKLLALVWPTREIISEEIK